MKEKYLDIALQGMVLSFTNHYGNLPVVSSPDSKPNIKVHLTNKQKKSRIAAKRAKKARKLCRKN